ncbi:hypothetical protein SDC9_133777 [bioreactor metagenome]|uniref:Uncharacterized protein n=1 Tax=bioreactor metagenome TaxID=1076179 RepID=A0A645DB77_9ZZZZ
MIAQVLADHAGNLVGVGDDGVERAVLRQPFDGGLRAALGDAGNAVDGVADQCQVIDDLFRRHAELGLDAGRVEHFLAHRVVPADLWPDQLGQILVTGGNQGVDAVVRSLRRQRADHVVGLDAVDAQHRPAGGGDGGVDRLDLGAQVVGHWRTVRLVLGIPVVAEGLALGVEDDGLVVRLVVAFQTT